jgi:hypothetical protein
MQATGGAPPYTWSATGLPSGVTLSATTGRISGTPSTTTRISLSATLTVKDSAGASASTPVTGTVAAPIAINNLLFKSQSGTVGKAYQLQLGATGGVTPYSWSATNLPPGLTIAADTGLISGTPTTAGSYSVVATVTDPAGGSDTMNLSYTIR